MRSDLSSIPFIEFQLLAAFCPQRMSLSSSAPPSSGSPEHPSVRHPPVLLAVDCSGSTGAQRGYWAHAAALLAALEARAAAGAGGAVATILLRDTAAEEVSAADFRAWCARAAGRGGTSPECVARHIRDAGFAGELVLVSDGQVDGSSVDACGAVLAGAPPLARVLVHLVNTGGVVNQSVACPFTRNCPFECLVITQTQVADGRYDFGDVPADEATGIDEAGTNAAAPLDAAGAAAAPRGLWLRVLGAGRVAAYASADDLHALAQLDSIGSRAAFDAAYPAIERVFVARLMGTAGDAPLRASVLAMQRRLVRADADSAEGAALGAALCAALRADDLDAAEGAVREMTAAAAAAGAGSVEARVSFLLRATEGALRRAFGPSEIAAQRAAAAPAAAAPAPQDVADVEVGEAAAEAAAVAAAPRFQCPVSLDDDAAAAANVVILLRAGPPLLSGLDKGLVNALLDCPLALAGDAPAFAPLRAALLARLDCAVSLPSLKSLCSMADAGVGNFADGEDDEEGDGVVGGYDRATTLLSPTSRQRVLRGGLCLGAAADHAEATDLSLFALLTGSRRVGSPDLWLAAVVRVLEEAQASGAASWLEAARPAMRAHLRWRLRHRTTFASLSGLATTVTTRLPLGDAAWFVLGGCAAQNDVTPRREALRAHLGHAAVLRWLVAEVSGVRLPARAERHAARLRLLAALLRASKAGEREWAAVRADLRALSQASIEIPPPPMGAKADPEAEAGAAGAGAGAGAAAGLAAALPQLTEPQRLLEAVRAREFGGRFALACVLPVDGPADAEAADRAWARLPAALRPAGVSRAEVVALSRYVDPRKAFGDIGVASDWEAGELRCPAPTWPTVRALRADQPPPSLRIVPATMRPASAVLRRETLETPQAASALRALAVAAALGADAAAAGAEAVAASAAAAATVEGREADAAAAAEGEEEEDEELPWVEAANAYYGVADASRPTLLLPTTRHWMDFAREYGAFATRANRDAFMLFLYARAASRGGPAGNRIALPRETIVFVEHAEAVFEPAVAGVSVTEAVRRFAASVKRTERRSIEEAAASEPRAAPACDAEAAASAAEPAASAAAEAASDEWLALPQRAQGRRRAAGAAGAAGVAGAAAAAAAAGAAAVAGAAAAAAEDAAAAAGEAQRKEDA